MPHPVHPITIDRLDLKKTGELLACHEPRFAYSVLAAANIAWHQQTREDYLANHQNLSRKGEQLGALIVPVLKLCIMCARQLAECECATKEALRAPGVAAFLPNVAWLGKQIAGLRYDAAIVVFEEYERVLRTQVHKTGSCSKKTSECDGVSMLKLKLADAVHKVPVKLMDMLRLSLRHMDNDLKERPLLVELELVDA